MVRMLNFLGFVPVALGGLGNNRGAIIGGLALGVFQQAANFLFGGVFASVAVFSVVHHRAAAGAAGPVRRPGAERVMTAYAASATRRCRRLRRRCRILPFVGIFAVGADPALRQQRLLDADRHARGDLLGTGLGAEPGGRLRRAARHRLGRAADARRLYHQRAGRRQRHAAGHRVRWRCGARPSSAAWSGVIVGLPALRLRTFYFAMTTLGFATIVTQIALAWQDVTGGGIGIVGPVLPAPFDTACGFYLFCLALAAFCTWISANVAHSRFGRSLVAIRDADVAAEATGISKPLLLSSVFLFAGAMAGIAGGLFATLQSYITPDAFTFDLSVLFFIAILIGGRGSILGPLIGTIVLTLLPEFAAPLVAWSTFLYAVLLLVIVLADAGRHRGAAGLPQPPAARQQSRHRCRAGRACRRSCAAAPADRR